MAHWKSIFNEVTESLIVCVVGVMEINHFIICIHNYFFKYSYGYSNLLVILGRNYSVAEPLRYGKSRQTVHQT